jgi:hypothetical protein
LERLSPDDHQITLAPWVEKFRLSPVDMIGWRADPEDRFADLN